MRELSEIKTIRKRLNLTQTQLAQASNVSQSLIAKIESEQLDPTYTKAVKIFEALDNFSEKKSLKAKDIMNSHVICLSPSNTLKEAIAKMKHHGISQIPVVDKNALGTITETVILDAITQNKSTATKVSDVMSDAPPTVSLDTNIDLISSLLKYFNIVLVAEKGKLKGVITKSDLIMKGI